jgi:hypothetical protein
LNSQLRATARIIIAILLGVYLAGTIRLAWPLLAHRADAGGMPWWNILGGFYLRFLVMLFLLYFLIRLKKGPNERK